MSRRPELLPRWALLLVLGGLLLAQQQALLHPLAHLQGLAQHAAAAHDEAAPACELCLACVAAAHLAAAGAPGVAAPQRGGAMAVAADLPALAAQAPSQQHNRGPPGRG